MVRNGYAVATQGNGSLAPDWTACVGCAVISRSMARNGEQLPAACADCFRKYCWDGVSDERDSVYNPSLRLADLALNETGKKKSVAAEGGRVAWTGLLGVVLLSVFFVL
jgi:lysophospholipase